MEGKDKPIKKILDELYGVTDEDIQKLVIDQEIEEEEKKIKILKELSSYTSFKDYVNDHEKEFEMVDITDDFCDIIILDDVYPNIDLDLLKKIGIVANHFGILIYIVQHEDDDTIIKKPKELRRKEKI